MKVSITPALTAELTINTDFAQAEVDEAVVNLTRFPLFFPEKREFFLERAGIFEFGLGGRRGGVAERNLQMYFSRRIGLTDDREPVPIIAGAKVTGRAAGMDVGFLNVQTGDFDDGFEDLDGSNYTVARVKRNILSRSNVGMFVSNRQSSGGDFNRVFGADANFTVFKNTDIQGFIGRSVTPGKDGNDAVGRLKYNWLSDLYEVFVEHLYIGPDFQHDVGFVRRLDIQRTDTAFIWEPRPEAFQHPEFRVPRRGRLHHRHPPAAAHPRADFPGDLTLSERRRRAVQRDRDVRSGGQRHSRSRPALSCHAVTTNSWTPGARPRRAASGRSAAGSESVAAISTAEPGSTFR